MNEDLQICQWHWNRLRTRISVARDYVFLSLGVATISLWVQNNTSIEYMLTCLIGGTIWSFSSLPP